MTQQPPYSAPPPEGNRPSYPGYPAPAPGYPSPGYIPQQPGPGYGPPPGHPGQPQQPGYPGGYVPPPGYHGYAPPPPQPAVSPAGQPLASFLDRFLAVLIDGAILFGAAMVVSVPAIILFFVVWMPDLFDIDPYAAEQPNPFTILGPLLLFEGILLLIILLMAYIYQVEMTFRSGQTVGKRVMKIKIMTVDPAGSLSRGTIGKRFLVQHVAATFLPGLSYLDGLWQLWDKPYQQCLHDKFARTLVVKVPA